MSSSIKTIGHKNPSVTYFKRLAARAILCDPTTKNIALIHVAKGNYFKLPGGGVEGDEDHRTAVAREILEETGCKASLDDDAFLVQCEEWRHDLNQVSYCYVAHLTEDTGKTELTDLETSEGFSHSWVTVDDAVRSMKEIQPSSELGHFVKERDLYFVETFMAGTTKRCC